MSLNDLAELLASFNITIKFFADDVKLYLKVVGRVRRVDEFELQNALSALVSRANIWQLSVPIDKCCVLSIGNGVVPSQFLPRDAMLSAVYATAIPSVCPSVCLSVCLSVRHTGGSVKNG